MKLNIAFRTLLAAICTASHARARATSYLPDPRTVEEKEQVQRQTTGEHISSTMLGTDACDANGICDTCGDRLAEAELEFQNDFSPKKAKSLACSAVSSEYSACHGCQGYSKLVRYYIALPCIQCKDQIPLYLCYDLTCCHHWLL